MQVISSISRLRAALASHHSIAFVPTMGNLHEGHMSLVMLAHQHAQTVVVSIFVNPLQFGAQEDLATYPRTLAADLDKLTKAQVDFVFTPDESELYPEPQTTRVRLPGIADELCGETRPQHFEGMATVVLKLFNIVQPQFAVFGQKDFQQLWIIRTLVQQLNLPITILSGTTVREPDGLAMSSRNQYLSAEERKLAPQLHATLQLLRRRLQQHCTLDQAQQQACASLAASSPLWRIHYLSIRRPDTLAPASIEDKSLIVLVAASLNYTRLIDNLEFSL